MRFVLEEDRYGLEHAVTLDVDVVVRIDQDVADRRIRKQGLDRTEPGHFRDQFVDEGLQLAGIERHALLADVLRDHLGNCPPQFVVGDVFDGREVDLVDELSMQAHFRIEDAPRDAERVGLLRDRLGRVIERENMRQGHGFDNGA